MTSYQIALGVLSFLLFGLSLIVVRRAWTAHEHDTANPDTEHGLVVATGISLVTAASVTTVLGDAFDITPMLAIGSAAIRAVLLTTLLYLILRRPHR